jgi:hypothetical protein
MRFGKRLAAAILSLAAIGVLGTAASASATTGVGGFTVLSAGEGNVAHTCTVIGGADGYQAVVCADITTGTGDTTYWARGQVEAYCQQGSGSTAVTVRCAQVYTAGRLSSANGGELNVGQWACGHQFGACSAGRNIIQTQTFTYTSANGCASNPNSQYNVWMVALVGSETAGSVTSIELPVSDKTVSLGTGNTNDGSNESTGHYYICA